MSAADGDGPGGAGSRRRGCGRGWFVALLAATVLVAACGRYPHGSGPDVAGGDGGAGPTDSSGALGPDLTAPPSLAAGQALAEPDPVTVLLAGEPNARFAPMWAADTQNLFTKNNLAVTPDPTGPLPDELAPAAASDGPEFVLGTVGQLLESRAKGSDLVEIAQLFQRSGTLLVSPASAPVKSLKGIKGKKLALLDGLDADVVAPAASLGLKEGKDYRATSAPFDPGVLSSGTVDAAQLNRYDEYAQLLENPDPATGATVRPSDFAVVDLEASGQALLADGVFARASWLADPKNQDIAVRFLTSLFEGEIFCRDKPADCAQMAVDAGSTLGLGHQAWMMNEVNSLIWPAPNGVGIVDPAAWSATVEKAVAAKIIPADPGPDAYRTDLAQKALANLAGQDTTGASFVKGNVPISPGGG